MVHTLTLNPAIDKLLYVQSLTRDFTCRVSRIQDTIGGKGTHVSINLQLCGVKNIACGVVHGPTGKQIVEMLEDFNIKTDFVYREDEDSRTNYLLIEPTGECTVVACKGPDLTDADVEDIIAVLTKNVKSGDILVLAGDASNSADIYVYNKICKAMRDKEVKIILDASEAYLMTCIEEKLFMIKPNLDEMSQLCKRKVTTDEADVLAAIHSLDSYDIDCIAVSLGKIGSIIKTPQGIFRATTPSYTVTKNTAGCGDCYLAGLIYGYENGLSVEEGLRFATAISSSASESELSVGYDLERAKALLKDIVIEQLE